MMTRKKFKELIAKMQEYNELYHKLYDLGIDIINCKYSETAEIFFDEIMRNEFGKEGLDLIAWWLYEDVDHKIYEPSPNAPEWRNPGEKYEGKVIADLNDIDDLYNYLVEGEDNKPNTKE